MSPRTKESPGEPGRAQESPGEPSKAQAYKMPSFILLDLGITNPQVNLCGKIVHDISHVFKVKN